MSNYTVSNLGQVAAAGSTNALFLQLFSGEILTAFERANVALDKTQVRTISNGKSAAFPIIGKTTAAYHTAGTELTGVAIKHNERVITIQDLLVAHTFIANIDEAKNHFQVRSLYANELGNALAVQMDKHIFQTVYNASKATALDPQAAGQSVTEANFLTDGKKAAEAIYAAAQILDENDVPESDRFAAVSPAVYYNMIKDTTAATINRDFGGQGSFADGNVFKIAGIQIVKTNNLPSGTISSGVGAGSIVGVLVIYVELLLMIKQLYGINHAAQL